MLLNIGGTLAGALGAFAAALLAARLLGHADFAAFGIGLAFHSLVVQLADIGFGSVTIAETASGSAADGGALASAPARALARSRVRSATVIGVVTTIVAVALPPIRPYAAVVAIASLGSVCASMTAFVVALLQAINRFTDAAAVLATLGFARLAGVLAVGLVTADELSMLLAYAVAAPVLAGAFGFMRVRRRISVHASAHEAPTRRSLRRAMLIAAPASAFLLNGDVILLILFSEESEVAVYAAAWRVAAGVLLLTNAIAFVALVHAMRSDDTAREVRRIVRVGLSTMTAILALSPLITYVGIALLGAGWSDAAAPLAVLVIAFGLDAFVGVAFQAYVRVDKSGLVAATAIIELVTMTVVTIILLPHGAMAPAFGQLAARIVGCIMVATPLMLARRNRLDWFQGLEPSVQP